MTMSNLFCAYPSASAAQEPPTKPHNLKDASGSSQENDPSNSGGGNFSSNASVGGVTIARQGSGALSTTNGSLRHDEPEVDYDLGPTELYKKIEGKDWDGALSILEQEPNQARIWISRREAGSDKTRWRLLALHATCIFRSPLAVIEQLIAAYPDGPQMKDDQGMLPVHLACRNGASKGVVLTLLNAFPESLRVRDRKGRVPMDMVQASTSQNREAVLVAMKRFEQEAKGQLRSLNASASSGGGVIRSDMTASGTVVTSEVDYEHRTILFRLILKKDWSAATARANSFPGEAGTWIVTKGFNGNLRFLPLHKACVLAPPDSMVEALVASHIDGAKARDQDGWLPLHCACFYGASDGVVNTLLVAHPKGAQCKDDEGRLPLHYACLKGASQSVIDSLLSSFPKSAMSKDDEGRLPIHHACSKGAPEGVIDALLKASPKGAQSKDDQGRLPLHHACRKAASERIVRTLLRVYPRAAQIKDDQDKLPIHYACQNGATAAVVNVLLTTYPESINVKNGFGYTPLAEARAIENPKMDPIIKVLEKFKNEQDRIKADSGENAQMEAKLNMLNQRVLQLESMLSNVAVMGRDLKAQAKKTRDPLALLHRMADRLSVLDNGSTLASANMTTTMDSVASSTGASNAAQTVSSSVHHGGASTAAASAGAAITSPTEASTSSNKTQSTTGRKSMFSGRGGANKTPSPAKSLRK